MNEEKAREILREGVIQPDNSLDDFGWYLAWPSAEGPRAGSLDGRFTADELEAIAWWMRNKAVLPKSPERGTVEA